MGRSSETNGAMSSQGSPYLPHTPPGRGFHMLLPLVSGIEASQHFPRSLRWLSVQRLLNWLRGKGSAGTEHLQNCRELDYFCSKVFFSLTQQLLRTAPCRCWRMHVQEVNSLPSHDWGKLPKGNEPQHLMWRRCAHRLGIYLLFLCLMWKWNEKMHKYQTCLIVNTTQKWTF